jgi:hypothetical protein
MPAKLTFAGVNITLSVPAGTVVPEAVVNDGEVEVTATRWR